MKIWKIAGLWVPHVHFNGSATPFVHWDVALSYARALAFQRFAEEE